MREIERGRRLRESGSDKIDGIRASEWTDPLLCLCWVHDEEAIS